MSMISVIIPVYKVEPYLRECVDSILAQTYTDFELILVDDGSPDNCGAICDEYAQQGARIRVIHQDNGGLSAARNAGLDIARGEFVTFVDSDDILHPDYLLCLAEAVWNNDAEIAIGRFIRFTQEPPEYTGAVASVKCVLNGREACRELYEADAVTYTIACAKLYKKALFSGIRFPVGKIHEDEATTYKLLYRACRIAVLENELYCYRQNPDGIMNTGFSVKRYHAIAAFEERIVFFKDHGEAELAELGEKALPLSLAKMAIQAASAGVEVPEKYRMRTAKALRIIRENCTDENYTYYLAMVRPNWLRPHAYLRKIKKILHIPCR